MDRAGYSPWGHKKQTQLSTRAHTCARTQHTHTHTGGTSREGSQSTIMVRSMKRQHLPGQCEKLVILDPHWEMTLEVSESV